MSIEALDALLGDFLHAQTERTLGARLFGDSAAGIQAYANNTRLNRADALGESYPTVRALVGDEFFYAMARRFAHTPSTDGDLNHYHPDFPDFIAGFAPAQSLPYLADCARLDWHGQRAYYAIDCAPFDFGKLAALGGGELYFRLHPAVALLGANFAIASIWLAHHGDGDFPASFTTPENALIWRTPENRVQVCALNDADFALLNGLDAGASLSAALEQALMHQENYDIQSALGQWIQAGVIIDVYEKA